MKDPIDPRLLERFTDAGERLGALDAELADPEVSRNPDRLRDLGRERAHLEPIVRIGSEIQHLVQELEGARELVSDEEDAEMRAMAAEEVTTLEGRLGTLEVQAKELLIPKDPLEDRTAVVEIRAGAGGDEAGLFAGNLFRMYKRVAERSGWGVELLSFSEGIPGSIKEVVFTLSGKGVYGQLRFESGVHRVQRVPETESQGRVHTSAATVAVLPEAEEVDVEIEDKDLRIDVFRSSGPGGQSVNTTDSAVRITHEPTGLVVSCQDEKSQLKNRNKAMKVLRARLLDLKISEQQAERARERKLQVGTGDRSAKIRTYNFPQGRVTDHRIGLTLYRLNEVLDGDLAELIAALRMAEQAERLESDGD